MSIRQGDNNNGAGPIAARPGRGDRPVTGRYSTPWGEGTVTVGHGRLIGVELPPVPAPAEGGTEPTAGIAPIDRAALERWTQELEAYFRGDRLGWTAPEIGLSALAAGSFERAVYEALVEVPPATTVSYGTLAEMAGHPRAARAVGTAMATNPIPVVVPCHRVIRSDGSLGRYGDEPAWKERLLEHERRHAGREQRKG